jgi:hypothetical protein
MPTRVVLLFVAVAAALGSGCESIRTIKINPDPQTVKVPGTVALAGNPLAPKDVFPSDALSEALAQSLSQSIETGGYDKDAVDKITLTKMELTVTEPNEGNRQLRGLGFMEQLTISASAEDVDPIVVAASDDGAFDGDPGPVSYEMPLTEDDMNPAFQAGDALELVADLEPSEPPDFETEVQFDTELTIVVNVFGALN